MSNGQNRKLLVSVFNAQEAREAVLGGGRIIDSEDPKTALGNIWPRQIMAVSEAVLEFQRGLDVQLSTNIGEDQLLFRRDDRGVAIPKSDAEIAGKAAQAAIGVAASMGTRVHPVSLVKVGLDGMPVGLLKSTLAEVVTSLQRSEHYAQTQVMSVLFAQDMTEWNLRKKLDRVRRQLVQSREYRKADPDNKDADSRFQLSALEESKTLWGGGSKPNVKSLIEQGFLPSDAKDDWVALNELLPHGDLFGQQAAPSARTTRPIIKAMVDATADAGAHAMMLDTSILTKSCDVCLVDTRGSEMVDFNPLYDAVGAPRQGILTLDDIRYFVDYCHYKGILANVAGSIDSFQAQMLWVLVPELDQLSTRGASSGASKEPGTTAAAVGQDSRRYKVIRRSLVRGLTPPEQGGVLNLPLSLQANKSAHDKIGPLRSLLVERRRALGLPALRVFWVDADGTPQAED